MDSILTAQNERRVAVIIILDGQLGSSRLKGASKVCLGCGQATGIESTFTCDMRKNRGSDEGVALFVQSQVPALHDLA